jgi:hypothetical protein
MVLLLGLTGADATEGVPVPLSTTSGCFWTTQSGSGASEWWPRSWRLVTAMVEMQLAAEIGEAT